MSGKADGKCSKEADSEDEFFDLGKNDAKFVPLNINILKIIFMTPEKDAIGAPLSIKIVFDIDREVVAGFWDLKFLVDTSGCRLIKKLVAITEDYPDGENEMIFDVPGIDVSDIEPSTLTNSGLLMAAFTVDGHETVSVNMVVNVFKEGGNIVRDILNPL